MTAEQAFLKWGKLHVRFLKYPQKRNGIIKALSRLKDVILDDPKVPIIVKQNLQRRYTQLEEMLKT